MSIIGFDLRVDDIEVVTALYDSIQVWRSPDNSGSPTPYIEITAENPTPAILDGAVVGPWSLNGTVLDVSLSGADVVTVSFSGANPWNLAMVLNAIHAVFPELAGEVPTDTNKVRLTSEHTGTGASIVLGGSAASVLGLGAKANGKSSRPVLTTSTRVYGVRDFDGSLAYWYKTRFYSSVTKAASAFSTPRQGAPQNVLSSFVAKAKVHLSDGTGSPVIGRRIIFVPVGVKVVDIGSGVLYASMPGIDRLIATTDDSGYAEMNLVRGGFYRVFFEGTTYQREFEVPDVSEFDLLTVLSTRPDVFTIVQSPPLPIRVS